MGAAASSNHGVDGATPEGEKKDQKGASTAASAVLVVSTVSAVLAVLAVHAVPIESDDEMQHGHAKAPPRSRV